MDNEPRVCKNLSFSYSRCGIPTTSSFDRCLSDLTSVLFAEENTLGDNKPPDTIQRRLTMINDVLLSINTLLS